MYLVGAAVLVRGVFEEVGMLRFGLRGLLLGCPMEEGYLGLGGGMQGLREDTGDRFGLVIFGDLWWVSRCLLVVTLGWAVEWKVCRLMVCW